MISGPRRVPRSVNAFGSTFGSSLIRPSADSAPLRFALFHTGAAQLRPFAAVAVPSRNAPVTILTRRKGDDIAGRLLGTVEGARLAEVAPRARDG
jgi:hypothetical protein